MEIREEEGTNTITDAKPDPDMGTEKPKATSKKKKKKGRCFEDFATTSSTSTGSSSNCRSKRVVQTRGRRPRVVFAPAQVGGLVEDGGGLEAIALPLGMSFAAVVAQVLERRDLIGERMSDDYLSTMCSSAVRESLANVFGGKFDCFARNFEKSFGSTLKTLRLISDSMNRGESRSSHPNIENSAAVISQRVCGTSSPDTDRHLEAAVMNQLNETEAVDRNVPTECGNQELVLLRQTSISKPLDTFERSVIEQSRSNDLKTVEINLTMRKLKLKEAELALSYDSNHIARSNLAVGMSKASFKVEKFKTQLEDTRHAELLRKCIDCLVAGLFIMSACLCYGAYVYSYKRIAEATASCSYSAEESKSWWIPRQVSFFNSGLAILWCQVQVVSRMLFGVLMVIAMAYLLLKRSATSHQTMPITVIVLLLAVLCGIAGKFCVDTLGGSGFYWLIYWETLCLLHVFSNIWTSTLYRILYGPISINIGTQHKVACHTWLRQSVFFGMMLVVLPLCCGLLPFAGPGEWTHHFVRLLTDGLSDDSEL